MTAALGTFAFVVTAGPSGGQAMFVEPTVSGVATCVADGTYSIAWTFSYTDTDPGTVDVSGPGVLSNAVTGTVDFTPATFAGPGTATGSSTVPGTTAGTVHLQRGWGSTAPSAGGGGAVGADVALDGTCRGPVEAAPRFTG